MILTTEILNNFKNVLKKENLKYTPQRISILEEVICGDGHRECEDIYLAIRQKGRAVSRATVYRTLDILVNNEFARKMDIGDGRIRYENKVNNPHHDHLVCTKCGIIGYCAALRSTRQ